LLDGLEHRDGDRQTSVGSVTELGREADGSSRSASVGGLVVRASVMPSESNQQWARLFLAEEVAR